MKKLIAEFFGTMFLVLLACGSAVLAGPKIGVLGIGLCFGLILLASYLATNVCQPGVSQGFALLTESLLTFLFVFVVLGATSRFGNSSLAGVAIGLTLGLVNIVGIPVDNCSVNPARSFGPALFSANAWPDFWIMVAGPLIGAVLAAIAWRLVAPCCCKKTEIDVTVKED